MGYTPKGNVKIGGSMPKYELSKEQVLQLNDILDSATIRGKDAERMVLLKQVFRRPLQPSEVKKG